MRDPEPEPNRLDAVAAALEVLASRTRLEILRALRSPASLHEIRVSPTLTRAGERAERPLTRQAVAHHLDALLRAGLVRRVESGDARGDAFALDPARLFALVDELRAVGKLRALAPIDAEPGLTLPEREGARLADLPPAPRLLLAYGRDDGVAFPLHGPVGSAWRIGRAAECEIALDYDAFASSVNARVERAKDGYFVTDLGSRNGTRVDWRAIPADEPVRLRNGALLGVGRSLLVFQEDDA